MPADNFARARASVVGRLRARRSEIDEAIFARVSDQWFDQAGSGDPEYVEGLRAAGVAALDYILTGVERSGESLAPVPVAVMEQARRAARVGVGLETVLRRYLAGYAVLEGFVLTEAEHDELLGRAGALRDVMQQTSALVDRLIAAVSRAYGEEVKRPNDNIRAEEIKTSVAISRRDRISRRERASQRDRILQAIAEVAGKRGLENTTVKLVSERAGVSTRTFYELFTGGLEDGLTAVIDMGLERVGIIASRALEREESWRDGMRAALAAVLSFFDREPDLARVLLVETLKGGPAVVSHREEAVDAFRALVVERIEHELPDASPLAAEGVLGAVMSVVRARLIAGESRPLIELLGPLMGLIVEHVADQRMAAEEARRGEALARAIQAGDDPGWVLLSSQAPGRDTEQGAGRGEGQGAGAWQGPVLPAALANPNARRVRECLLFLAEQGERGLSPSNREIAAGIGVSHKSQISKLLSRLHDEGLAVKRSVRPGGPNKWRLTPRGKEVARALGAEDFHKDGI
jgi:AcrR family transcriptional regulator